MAQQDDPLIGRKLHGTIEIVRRIGEGGMGYIYEGYQAHLERKLAVKVMTPEHARNPIASRYFIREAKSASRLRHPHVIQIIDFGREDDEILFIAMEFVPGQPLTELLRGGQGLEPARLVPILEQTLSGLEEAHAHEIIHRDLKPDNLMVEQTRDGDDFVKILDFGIAHQAGAEAREGPLTQQGAVLGTPQYMSPEQARGERVDARSDIFSMGIILYEGLTGALPFTGRSMPAILMAVIDEDPPAPSARRPELDIDPRLEAICLRALKKDAALRYQSAREFRRALEQAAEARARPPEEPEPTAPAARFIFKRPKSVMRARRQVQEEADAASPRRAPRAQASEDALAQARADEQALPHGDTVSAGLGEEDSHVVDVEDLFSQIEGRAAPDLDELAPPIQEDLAPATDASAPAPASEELELPELDAPTLAGEMEALREDLLGERRHVGVLVLHQRTHGGLDAEDLHDVHAALDAQLDQLCEQWRGQVQSRQGGYATLLFGFEAPRSDDIFRTTQAALTLRKQLRKLPDGVGFGLAVGAGEVFGPGGELARASGAPLEVCTDAARRAGDDEILAVGQDLQDRLEATFRLGAQTPSGDRPVLAVLDIEQAQTMQAGDLVGRDDEIATVLGALGRLSRGQGSLLAISGEGGVGKSALIREAISLAQPRDVLVLRARWRQRGAQGLTDLLRQWLIDWLRQLGRTREQLGEALLEQDIAPEYGRLLEALLRDRLRELIGFKGHQRAAAAETDTTRAVEAATRKLLAHLARQRGVLVVLDEIQDLDDPELDGMLHRLSQLTEDHRVLAICAARAMLGEFPPELPGPTSSIHLEPLAPHASLAYLRLRLPESAPEALRQRLVRLSASNPLQLEQLTDYVLDHPEASLEELETSLSQASGVRELMRIRLFGLDRRAQNVLGLLAVLGDGADARAVVDLASPSWEPEQTLQQLYEGGLLEVEETDVSARIYFSPPALGPVVHDSMSRKARRRAHERAARYRREVIRASAKRAPRQEVLGLVRHLDELGEQARAAALLERLARDAALSFEYGAARELLERALTMATLEPAERARLELELARAQHAQGHTREALDRVVALDRQQELPEALSREIRLTLAQLWLEEEDPMLLERMLKKLIGQARKAAHEDPERTWLLVRALGLLAQVHERQRRLPAAMRALLEAIELTERAELSVRENPWGPSLIWEPLNQLGRLRLKDEQREGARKMFRLALNVAREAEDVRGEIAVRANTATLLTLDGKLDGARRQLEVALELAGRLGEVRTLAKLHHNRGMLHLRQHHTRAAREAFEHSLSLSRELDWREGVAMNVQRLRGLEPRA